MDKASAFALADRLRRQLTASPGIRDVQPQQLNPLNGDANLGWGVRVSRTDLGDLDIYGSERSGYSTMQQTGGFMPLERLLVEKVLPSEPLIEVSPPDDEDLVGRLTRLSSAAAEIAAEAAAIRDEIALRTNR